MARPPFTLWRSTALDLWRLAALTAAVLVTVIAFGATVKPLADGKLQAADVLRFSLYAMPAMLAYALPFAGGFAGTLVYHRLASDNELLAAHAGGISHRTMLIPALVTGILLAGMLWGLNDRVIPRFLHAMQRLVTVDVARLLAQRIEQGRSLEMQGMMIWADQALRVAPDPASGSVEQLALAGFAAVERNSEGEVITEVTAERARLWLFPSEAGGPGGDDGAQTRIVMRLENVVAMQQGRGMGGARDRVDLSWSVPDAFKDDPKFMSRREMLALADRPERLSWIDLRRRDVAYHVARRDAVALVDQALRTGGEAQLLDESGARVIVRGGGLVPRDGAWVILPSGGVGGGTVVVDRPRGGSGRGGRLVLEAEQGVLSVDLGSDRFLRSLELRVQLERVRARRDGDADAPTPERSALIVGGLRPVEDVAQRALALPTQELVRTASALLAERDDPGLREALRDLELKLGELDREVLSKLHERFVMSASCLIMVLTGAVTAVRFSKSLPLTVYAWTFIPSLVAYMTMAGGQQLTADVGPHGLWLIWAGVLALAVYTLVIYRKIAEH